MEQKNIITPESWDLIESITSEILEDEFDSLSPKELSSIKKHIEEGDPILSSSDASGMAFNFGDTITMVSICMTLISILIEFYKLRKEKVSKKEFIDWLMSDGQLQAIPVVTQSFKDFVMAHYDEIVKRV